MSPGHLAKLDIGGTQFLQQQAHLAGVLKPASEDGCQDQISTWLRSRLKGVGARDVEASG
jgi:hypothetical protein